MRESKLKEFQKCLQEERFYDAHEVLEEIWFPRRFEKSNEVKLLKGFINAAVSFELIKKGRFQQSKKVWSTYLKYRQLLFLIEPHYRNQYYKLSRHVETIQKEISLISHSFAI
jgi:hypothetical protein